MIQIAIGLVALLCLIIQTTLFRMYGSLAPDVLLVIAVFCGLNYRKLAGFQAGLMLGLLQDLLSYKMLGVNLLSKGLIGFGCGYMRELNVVSTSSRGTWAFLITVATMLNEFIWQIIQNGFYGIEVTAWGLFSGMLFQSLMNLFFGLPLFMLLDYLHDLLVGGENQLEF